MHAFRKVQMARKDQEKWQRILTTNMMSSEESSSDLDNKLLPWRSQIVTNFLTKLDQKSFEIKSPLAKRLRKDRQVSENMSDREMPLGIPQWAVTNN